MSTTTEKTWEQYVSSWKAASAEAKRALFERCLSPRCVYTDPTTKADGWDALLSYMLEFHRQVPGGHFVTTYFRAHHGRSIARWNMVDGEGTVLGDGTSYGQYDEAGKLTAMVGFFDAPPQ
ncbi:MAG: nuclear transport factor 2 family protein [Deltaproteobacteria bacterium]|nr:nuclear transport factor 2 family protein [Deltaproteobacteria bacterium]